LDSLLAELSTLPKLYTDTLYKFDSICCSPTILARYPPLTTLLQHWHILLPLDPAIPALPLHAALGVFPVPHTRSHDIKAAYSFTEPSVTFTIKVGPGATKKDIHAGLDPLLAFAMPRLDQCIGYRPKRVKRKWEKEQELEYYPTLFLIYDLHCAGMSDADIARRVFVQDFQDIKEPYDYDNDAYKKILLRVAYYLERARELINTV
jgi:hypothetical protein